MKRSSAIAFAAVAGFAVAANAQFITGITKPVFSVNQPEAFFTDLDALTNTFLFDIELDTGIPATAPGFTGLAGDDANRRFFATVRNGPQDDVWEFDYDDLLNPTLLFTVRQPDGSGQAINGLAYDTTRNKLYGSGRLNNELYEIDINTGTVTVVLDYSTLIGGANNWTVTSVEYYAGTDLIYIVNRDPGAQPGRAIWSLDPENLGAGPTLVAQLPPDITNPDGLGAGDGKLFLVTGHNTINNGRHIVYDLATGEFTQPIETPYPAPAGSPLQPIPSAAGAFVPGLFGDVCIPDLNGDGVVDADDFFLFLQLFADGDSRADINNDGVIDADDFFAYLGLFAAGC